MEFGESSGCSKPLSDEEVWAKLVPLDSRFSEIEIRSNETVVCSDITSSSGKRVWCQLTRNSDLCSAKIKNKSSSAILVDGAMVQNNNVVSIKCGSEIVPGSVGKGHLKYKFEVMPVQVLQDVSGQSILKISMDVEHAKCSICLSVWHDVVTVAPCLHNFCNGCFSEWLRRCQEKRTSTLCPQCRGVKQFVGRNHFLRNIEEDILKADPSLRRPKDELGVLDSYARIKSNMDVEGDDIEEDEENDEENDYDDDDYESNDIEEDEENDEENEDDDEEDDNADDRNEAPHQFGGLRQDISAITRSMGDLRLRADEQYSSLSQRLGALELRVDERFSSISLRLGALEQRQQQQMHWMNQQMHWMDQQRHWMNQQMHWMNQQHMFYDPNAPFPPPPPPNAPFPPLPPPPPPPQ